MHTYIAKVICNGRAYFSLYYYDEKIGHEVLLIKNGAILSFNCYDEALSFATSNDLEACEQIELDFDMEITSVIFGRDVIRKWNLITVMQGAFGMKTKYLLPEYDHLYNFIFDRSANEMVQITLDKHYVALLKNIFSEAKEIF